MAAKINRPVINPIDFMLCNVSVKYGKAATPIAAEIKHSAIKGRIGKNLVMILSPTEPITPPRLIIPKTVVASEEE
jgi:hypothetical protein